MQADDQRKWNEKYRNATLSTPAEPVWVLRQHTRLLPLQGKALDLAAGLGGNARYLAQCGLSAYAWDISDTAMEHLADYARRFKLPIQTRVIDLNQPHWPDEQFHVVAISRWLDRTAFARIGHLVKPEGFLFWQTFLAPVQSNAPRNPDYYLHSGELVRAYATWRIHVHGEGWLDDQDGQKRRYSWIVAQKPA